VLFNSLYLIFVSLILKLNSTPGSAGTDPSKDLPPSKGKQLSAPVGISPLLKRVSRELSAITGIDVVPVEDFPVNSDVQRPRTWSTSRIVPPAQSVIDSLWVPDRVAIRPQVPRGEVDPTKPPFTIDGKTLQPVLERFDQGKIKIRQSGKLYISRCFLASTSQSPTAVPLGYGSLAPTQETILALEKHQAIPSPVHGTDQATPSRAKAKGNRFGVLLPGNY
jgi:hypothetical protein